MPKEKNTTGRLVQVNAEGEGDIHVDPSNVIAVTGEGQASTLHLVGGGSVNVGRPAAEVRKLLNL